MTISSAKKLSLDTYTPEKDRLTLSYITDTGLTFFPTSVQPEQLVVSETCEYSDLTPISIRCDSVVGKSFASGFLKEYDDYAYEQFPHKRLTVALNIASTLSKMVRNNVEDTGLVVKYTQSSVDHSVPNSHIFSSLTKSLPDWLIQRPSQRTPSYVDYVKGWFAPHADPKLLGTPYLIPVFLGIRTQLSERTSTTSFVWQVRQVGIDVKPQQYLSFCEWDDDQAWLDLVDIVKNYTVENVCALRLLTNPQHYSEKVAEKDFSISYENLWKQAQPRAMRISSKVEKSLKEYVRVYFGGRTVYLADVSKFGLGGIKSRSMRDSTYQYHNIVCKLYVRVPTMREPSSDGETYKTLSVKISEKLQQIDPGLKLYKNTSNERYRQTWWVAKDEDLFLSSYPYFDIPEKFAQWTAKDPKEELKRWNPAKKKWEKLA